MGNRNVLVALDRSEYGKKILPEIEKLIQPQDTSIILFHVADIQRSIGVDMPSYEYESPGHVITMHSPTRMPHPIYATQEEDAIQDQVKIELRAETDRLREAGYDASTLVYFGDPKKEILNVIADKEIDLVAMTTHAREGLGKLLFGSVAEHVLHHVNVPILMMRPS